jgi:hypothetical protein
MQSLFGSRGLPARVHRAHGRHGSEGVLPLFDRLAGEGQQLFGDFRPEDFGGLEVDQ